MKIPVIFLRKSNEIQCHHLIFVNVFNSYDHHVPKKMFKQKFFLNTNKVDVISIRCKTLFLKSLYSWFYFS